MSENFEKLKNSLEGLADYSAGELYEDVKKTLNYQKIDYGFERTRSTDSDSVFGEHYIEKLEVQEWEDELYDVKVILTAPKGNTPRIEFEEK